MIGIYKIISPNNRVYVGQSIDIERRFRFYKNLNCKRQIILYNSLIKYGVANHKFEVIEECIFEQLNTRERYWQDYYNVINDGLNCQLTSTNELPKVHSQLTKDKIANSNKGRVFSKCHINRMSETKKKSSLGSDNNFYGKHHTKEFINQRSNERKRGGNPNAKLVLNLETGIYYESSKDAADIIGVNYNTMKSWLYLKNNVKNKTSFIYV